FPSIDAFFYGSKPTSAQGLAKLNWTTKPVSWLSDFQRNTVGYTPFTGEDKMWKDIQNIRDSYAPALANLSPSSTAYQDLKNARDLTIQTIGSQYGQQGVDAVTLDLADPYKRLQSNGFGKNNQSFQ